jgi:hypothetical protein
MSRELLDDVPLASNSYLSVEDYADSSGCQGRYGPSIRKPATPNRSQQRSLDQGDDPCGYSDEGLSG